MIRQRLLKLCSLIALFVVTALAQAQVDENRLYQRVLRSSNWVIAPELSGSGVVIDVQRRLVLTNYHVVRENSSVQVVFPLYQDGQVMRDRDYYFKNWEKFARSGRVLHRDSAKDLALIQLDSLPYGIEAMPLAQSSVAVNDQVFRIGSPAAQGSAWTFSKGTTKFLQNFKANYDNGQKTEAFTLFSDMPGIKGHSGAATCNHLGELVAIHAAEHSESKMSMGVHLSDVRRFLSQSKAFSQFASAGN